MADDGFFIKRLYEEVDLEDFDVTRDDGLVLKIDEEKKVEFVESLKAHINGGRILLALEETVVTHYSNLGADVMSSEQAYGMRDFYMECLEKGRVDAIQLSKNIHGLTDMSPFHKVLYAELADYVIENNFGEYVKPEELAPEPPEPVKLGTNIAERIQQIESKRKDLVAERDTAASGYRGKD